MWYLLCAGRTSDSSHSVQGAVSPFRTWAFSPHYVGRSERLWPVETPERLFFNIISRWSCALHIWHISCAGTVEGVMWMQLRTGAFKQELFKLAAFARKQWGTQAGCVSPLWMLEKLCLVRQVGDGEQPKVGVWLPGREKAKFQWNWCGKDPFPKADWQMLLLLISFSAYLWMPALLKKWEMFGNLSVTVWFYWSLKWLWICSFRMNIMNAVFFIEINSECSLSSNYKCVKCSPFQALGVQAAWQ